VWLKLGSYPHVYHHYPSTYMARQDIDASATVKEILHHLGGDLLRV
jgi:hypothetical protein